MQRGEGGENALKEEVWSVCVCLRGMDRRIGNFGPFSVTSSFQGMVFLAIPFSRDGGVGD